MSEFLQGVLLVMLTASVMLQFCAAFMAFGFLRLSRCHFSWVMLSTALLLMAFRRAITFYDLTTGAVAVSFDFYAEATAFLISLLVVTALFSIAPLLRRLYAAPDSLFQSSCGTALCDLSANINSGVVVYSAVEKGTDFVIRYMNPAAAQIEKIAGEHVIGRRLTEVFPGVEEFGLLEVLRRVWKSGRAESFPLHYYQDGRISGWRDNRVYRRASGDVVAVYNDVSPQMKMQEELERRERKFRMLYEQAPLPYQSIDRDGNILDVNPAWLRLTGLNREQAAGRNFNELLTREGRRSLQSSLDELRAGKNISGLEMDLRCSGGALVRIALDALALRDRNGAIDRIYCILKEVTDAPNEGRSPGTERALEKQVSERTLEQLAGQRRALQTRELELLGALAAGMAHELNTPLTAARNAFSLLQGSIPPSAPGSEFAGMAGQELDRMAELVEQMYRANEPVSAGCEPVHLNALLDNALILLRPAMQERRIELSDARAETLPVVELPPGAVMRVLINPMKNSIEALSPEGVLTLRTGTAEAGGVWVEIEDNGPGIPEDFLPHLFEPFTSFRHDSGRQGSRIGLGMATVQHIVNTLGGSVRVRSRTGEGTCVRIVLPARMAGNR